MMKMKKIVACLLGITFCAGLICGISLANSTEDSQEEANYLTFESEAAFTLTLYDQTFEEEIVLEESTFVTQFGWEEAFSFFVGEEATEPSWDGILEYSVDTVNWTIWNGETIYAGESNGTWVLYLRGEENTYITGCHTPYLSNDDASGVYEYLRYFALRAVEENSTALIDCSGNIMNLLDYKKVASGEEITMGRACFFGLFATNTLLGSAPELPAMNLSEACYSHMFEGCAALTVAPDLPATTLARLCYASMFSGCLSLTVAPDLPATDLSGFSYDDTYLLEEGCYNAMFQWCIALKEAPVISATKMGVSSCVAMFSYCLSLTEAPELLATELGERCYYMMFNLCISLTEAPTLPATVVPNSAYQAMFAECYSLVVAPDLPATEVYEQGYSGMFEYCTSLEVPPVIGATTLSGYEEMAYMFIGCSALKISEEMVDGYTRAYQFVSEEAVYSDKYTFTGILNKTGGTYTGDIKPGVTYYVWCNHLLVENENIEETDTHNVYCAYDGCGALVETEDCTFVVTEADWAKDGSSVTYTYACSCGNTHTTAAIESVVIDSLDATCEEEGYKTYSVAEATATNGQTLDVSKFTYTVTLEAIGHDYVVSVADWAKDGSYVTYTYYCTHDKSHTATTDTLEGILIDSLDPTCEEDGYLTYSVTKAEASNGQTLDVSEFTYTVTLDAIGHEYVVSAADWAKDGSTVTYTYYCTNDKSHTATTDTLESIVIDSLDATCEEDGYITYSVTEAKASNGQTLDVSEFTYTVILDAIGHDYVVSAADWAKDGSTVTYTYYCTNDKSHTATTDTLEGILIDSLDPTCEEDGYLTYSVAEAKASNGQTLDVSKFTYTVTLEAIGHEYVVSAANWAKDGSSVTYTYYCTNDKSHTATTDTLESIVIDRMDATCEEDGYITYSVAEAKASNGQTLDVSKFTYTVTLDAIGHEYVVSAANWAKDGSTVTYTYYCTNDKSHTATTDTLESIVIDSLDATCEEDGYITYSVTEAKASNGQTLDVSEFTYTVILDAIGHDYVVSAADWAEDGSSVTYTYYCTHDKSHTATTDTLEGIVIDSLDATCEEDGYLTYSVAEAKATNGQTLDVSEFTYTVILDAIGHEYVVSAADWAKDGSTVTYTYYCTHDETHVHTTEALAGVVLESQDPTCEEAGYIIYTVELVEAENGQTLDVSEFNYTRNLEALGHAYAFTYVFSNDNTYATGTLTCAQCDEVITLSSTDAGCVFTSTEDSDGNLVLKVSFEYDGETYSAKKVIAAEVTEEETSEEETTEEVEEESAFADYAEDENAVLDSDEEALEEVEDTEAAEETKESKTLGAAVYAVIAAVLVACAAFLIFFLTKRSKKEEQ